MAEITVSEGSKAKARTPTWAEWLAMEKQLESLYGSMGDLDLLIWAEEKRASGKSGDADLLNLATNLKRAIMEGSSSLSREYLLLDDPDLAPDSRERLKLAIKEERLRAMHEYQRLRDGQRDPDFSGMTEADRDTEAERLRQEALQDAARRFEDDPERRRLEARARILDFDPKQGGVYYNAYSWFEDDGVAATFDLAEESPIGPMRFFLDDNREEVCTAVNVLSVKVAWSDVGFPIHVYGTVVARDSTDYLFRHDRDHCQLVNSKNDPLVLTGPKRGLAMLDGNYIEIDLKIRDHHLQGQDDRELSKGVLMIQGIVGRSLQKCTVEKLSLHTRLSTMKMVYAVVVSAVEATIAIEILEGEFRGIVTADTTSVKKRIVLYDSQQAGDGDGRRPAPVKMMRPVVCACVKDQLIITAMAFGGNTAVFTFRPKFSRGYVSELELGVAKVRMRVAWSTMDPTNLR